MEHDTPQSLTGATRRPRRSTRTLAFTAVLSSVLGLGVIAAGPAFAATNVQFDFSNNTNHTVTASIVYGGSGSANVGAFQTGHLTVQTGREAELRVVDQSRTTNAVFFVDLQAKHCGTGYTFSMLSPSCSR